MESGERSRRQPGGLSGAAGSEVSSSIEAGSGPKKPDAPTEIAVRRLITK